MNIEVLGTGCTTCNTVEVIVREAVAKCKIEVEVVKVSNRLEIAKTGVVLTPAVIVDGQIKLVGKNPEPENEDVIRWIKVDGP